VSDWYNSPRWSGEILDCSMPMTFDTYSACSYRCIYCFSFFQRSIGGAKRRYLTQGALSVNPDKVRRIFTEPNSSGFWPYVADRKVMQWGGLSDQFDENERKHGVTLELIRFFREIQYPISFSTKSTWWTEDPRYIELFQGAEHFNVKFSIITLNEDKAHKIEVLVDTPFQRIEAIRRVAKWGIGGVTLRLRPFIIGVSTDSYLELIRRAADAGAEAVSTEFLCVETRAKLAKNRFEALGRLAGYNLAGMYKAVSQTRSGYMRLNREIKRPYIEAMHEQCDKFGLRFYVSDAHFKEHCANGSCCGLRPTFNYSHSQFTEALLIAKQARQVRWSDISEGLGWAKNTFEQAGCGNKGGPARCAKFGDLTQKEWLHWHWNNVNHPNSPYKYFGGVLLPEEQRDAAGDIVYRYVGDE
jgi:DNA repair photolyase